MEKAKVYFTDFHTEAFGDGLPTKLKKLMKKAGIADLDLDGKFVAIKMHFGELGNISYLRPNYARAVVDVVKELGAGPSSLTATPCTPAAGRTPWSTWSAPGRTALPSYRGLSHPHRRRLEGY